MISFNNERTNRLPPLIEDTERGDRLSASDISFKLVVGEFCRECCCNRLSSSWKYLQSYNR